MSGVWGERLRRGLRRSPGELAHRLWFEIKAQSVRVLGDPTAGQNAEGFAGRFDAIDIDDLWGELAARPFPVVFGGIDPDRLDALLPGERARVLAAADLAKRRMVSVLGSGLVPLDKPVRWHRDVKSGIEWPANFFRDIDVLDHAQPSDIKMPWEVSRLQWLVPVGQSYLLDGDPAHAAFVRDILEEWIDGNAYGQGPNWATTMEPAMRVFTWAWFFHVFKNSAPWADPEFRLRFLRCLYGHLHFIHRHLEDFGVNGNHLTADASALVFGGLFFGSGPAQRWAKRGWEVLRRELPRQVHGDGVCFELSVGYHRLVAELFMWAVRYRQVMGLEAPGNVLARLAKMAGFTTAYTRPDGRAPLWGDGDDSRVLPFGGQPISDHSYLPALLATVCGTKPAGRRPTREALAEIVWALGIEAAEAAANEDDAGRESAAFSEAGVYVLAAGEDHVFVDAGGVGFAGRGVHGHNDCLSFEAVLAGVSLITDSGSFVYTADLAERDRFRATAAHNTPMVDGEEQNRIPAGEPFMLADDTRAVIRRWRRGSGGEELIAAHTGYQRLVSPVTVSRGFFLDKKHHALVVLDRFEGSSDHWVDVAYHFAPGVSVVEDGVGRWRLTANGQAFLFLVDGEGEWSATVEDGWVSPSYGIKVPRRVLRLHHDRPLMPIAVGVLPEADAPADLRGWLSAKAEQLWLDA